MIEKLNAGAVELDHFALAQRLQSPVGEADALVSRKPSELVFDLNHGGFVQLVGARGPSPKRTFRRPTMALPWCWSRLEPWSDAFEPK